MRKLTVIIVGIVVLFSACSVEVKKEELKPMLFGQSRGLIAGVDIGDTWEEVKENYPEGWTVRESHEDGLDIYQIRKDWDEGSNYMNLSFGFDEEGLINEMRYTLTLSDKSRLALVEVQKMFIADFNRVTLQEKTDQWKYYGPDGNPYIISLQVIELNENTESLAIDVVKV
ncbi:hypothetical protein [Parvicella tangerina]|uniref:Uncharacterized protein n=1 Tax=Parvicella tangerina TaxID=2829795 RepID=A0A916NEJ3_9FLAO|nr:hypothetical protein [Parvicella tangerina]CAG5076322.1 hypothetical protein CRYO30217_00065 [Parvicella tangerina]